MALSNFLNTVALIVTGFAHLSGNECAVVAFDVGFLGIKVNVITRNVQTGPFLTFTNLIDVDQKGLLFFFAERFLSRWCAFTLACNESLQLNIASQWQK